MWLNDRLLQDSRRILIGCAEFETDEALRAVFVSDELSPFRNNLPEASNRTQRVDFLIQYLLPRRLSDNRPVFPLFIKSLRDRYHVGDHLRIDLDELYEKVRAARQQQILDDGFPDTKHKTKADRYLKRTNQPKKEDTTSEFLVCKIQESSDSAVQNPRLYEMLEKLKSAQKNVNYQLHIFASGEIIYPDQCENAIHDIGELEVAINTISALIPSQYKALIPVIHLQSQVKTLKEYLVEFCKTCPPGERDKKQQVKSQFGLLENSLARLDNAF